LLAGLFGLFFLVLPGRAEAQTAACNNDVDCPGAECGGQTCVHSSGAATCLDANTAYQSGAGDGHCAVDTDCKCHAMGAVCSGFYCSFTVPNDGGAGGSTGTGGSTGAAGSTGTGGSSHAGTSGGSGGGGGGCSVAGVPTAGGSIAFALFAAALMRRRARRRA
jgi:hypothetical protein